MLSVEQLAEALNVGPQKIRRMQKANELPFYMVGHQARFDLQEVKDAFRAESK